MRPGHHRKGSVRSLDRKTAQTHGSLRETRKVDTGPYIESDGQSHEIVPTACEFVPVFFHPFRKLWVPEHSHKLTLSPILDSFTRKSV
jgi:hypothetical protein